MINGSLNDILNDERYLNLIKDEYVINLHEFKKLTNVYKRDDENIKQLVIVFESSEFSYKQKILATVMLEMFQHRDYVIFDAMKTELKQILLQTMWQDEVKEMKETVKNCKSYKSVENIAKKYEPIATMFIFNKFMPTTQKTNWLRERIQNIFWIYVKLSKVIALRKDCNHVIEEMRLIIHELFEDASILGNKEDIVTLSLKKQIHLKTDTLAQRLAKHAINCSRERKTTKIIAFLLLKLNYELEIKDLFTVLFLKRLIKQKFETYVGFGVIKEVVLC